MGVGNIETLNSGAQDWCSRGWRGADGTLVPAQCLALRSPRTYSPCCLQLRPALLTGWGGSQCHRAAGKRGWERGSALPGSQRKAPGSRRAVTERDKEWIITQRALMDWSQLPAHTGRQKQTWETFLGKDHLEILRYGRERVSRRHWQWKQASTDGPTDLHALRSPSV